ncbi:MAG: GNAT family N-acetyltransferase [Flavisolibacter sp.]
MEIDWKLKTFETLRPSELYAILQLRIAVFVVEQQCIFQDADDKDQCSYHLMGWKDHQLVAYTRLVPPGEIYEQPSIGRVVTAASSRKTGAGRLLMKKSIEACHELFGKQPIKIGAQLYLQDFYNSMGFERVSDVYMEDGIEHIYMIRE